MTRELFIVTLTPQPGVAGLLALRALLKVALRSFGLRCLSVKITLGDDPPLLEERAQSRVANSATHAPKSCAGDGK
jgi:hypothetical protein